LYGFLSLLAVVTASQIALVEPVQSSRITIGHGLQHLRQHGGIKLAHRALQDIVQPLLCTGGIADQASSSALSGPVNS
jgi:hypothetical protein